MTTPEEAARAARERFVKWLEWYVAVYPAESGGSFEQVAPKIGITPAAISKWRKSGSTTYPHLANLVKLYLLIAKAWEGFKIDDLMFRNPPPIPRR